MSSSSSSSSSAIITLVTSDDFVIGANLLSYSLRCVKTSYPLYVMITENVSASARLSLMNQGGWQIIIVPYIPNPSTDVHVTSWIEVGFTKLRLWQLIKFNLLFYIDADCIVTRNVDHIIADAPADLQFAACPDVFPPSNFNAGVMLLRPNLTMFHYLLCQMPIHSSYDGGDTGFLNAIYHNWFHSNSFNQTNNNNKKNTNNQVTTTTTTNNPTPDNNNIIDSLNNNVGVYRFSFGYNALRLMEWYTKKKASYWDSIENQLYIIHYCSSPKPW